MTRLLPLIRFIALVSFTIACSQSSAHADILRLISSGDALPGGGFAYDFSPPIVNDTGDVLVQARFDNEPDGSADGRVLLLIPSGGSVVEVARTGDPLGDGTTIANFLTPGVPTTTHYLLDSGVAAFAVIRSSGAGGAILTGQGGPFIVHVADGDAVPGSTTGETISSLKLWGYAIGGQLLYSFQPKTQYNTGAVEFWRDSARVAWQGQTYSTTTIYDVRYVAVAATGDILVSARVLSSPSPNDRAWFRPFEGNLQLMLDELQPAPNGGTFQLDLYGGAVFYNPTLAIGFGAALSGVPSTEDFGAYLGGGGSEVELLREGQAAPGGGTWASIDEWDFDEGSNLFVKAEEVRDGDTNWYQYLLSVTPGGLVSVIAVEGDPDPSASGTFYSFTEGARNYSGQVAALGTVRIASTNYEALWFWSGGAASVLAQVGQNLDGQILTNIDFAGRAGNAVHRSAMNANGDVAFMAEGATRKAIYLSQAATGVGAPPSADSLVQLEGAYPNPFNPRTNVAFSVDRERDVTLTVYDMRGRLVRTLLEDRVPAGRHEMLWTGVDESGRPVSSGTYFCQLRAGDLTRRIKLSLIR